VFESMLEKEGKMDVGAGHCDVILRRSCRQEEADRHWGERAVATLPSGVVIARGNGSARDGRGADPC
jgi:hypothetical protein